MRLRMQVTAARAPRRGVRSLPGGRYGHLRSSKRLTMPWHGAGTRASFPSLGWKLLEWWSDHPAVPRDHSEPLMFTGEQALILVEWYTFDPVTLKFIYRRGCSRRSKGWGKSPVEAAKAIAALAGDVRFGRLGRRREPVGQAVGHARVTRTRGCRSPRCRRTRPTTRTR
jgi:hypothetical protein